MNAARIRWIALGAAAIILVFGYASLMRTVTVMADGNVTTVASRALTVGGVLQDAGVRMNAEDKAEPSNWSLVTDGLVINVQRAARVQLIADGKTFTAISAEQDPISLLSRWGLKLNSGDRLVFNGRTLEEGEQLPQAAFLSLQLRRPVDFSVRDGESLVEFQSSALTLGEALREESIDLLAADRVQPSADSVIMGSTTATITRAEPLLVVMGSSVTEVRTAAATVGEALADAGIALQGLDRSQPDEDQPIPSDRRIRVIRISEIVQMQQEAIPFETVWQPDPDAEVGTTSVVQEGQRGLSATRVRTRYEDGHEVSQITEDSRVLVTPLDQINGYGGQIVIRTIVLGDVEIEYWATMSMYATSYSPCRSGVEGKCYTGTSFGVPVQHGVVATYLDWYRAYKGGSVYIPGYGAAIVADVGGGFPDGRAWIDLGYSDSDWVGWSGWVTVYFTTPVPAAIPYFLQ